jgi:hypothetical protein
LIFEAIEMIASDHGNFAEAFYTFGTSNCQAPAACSEIAILMRFRRVCRA